MEEKQKTNIYSKKNNGVITKKRKFNVRHKKKLEAVELDAVKRSMRI